MLGILYLLLCLAVGYTFISLCLPELLNIMKRSFKGKVINLPSSLVVFPASMLFGTLFMSWPTYFLAWAFHNSSSALSVANRLVFSAAFVFVVAGICILRRKTLKNLKNVVKGSDPLDILLISVALVLSIVLTFYSFRISGGKVLVGVSVCSDFSTHMGMLRSFSNGGNFPTWYSHFAGEDIKYHFMFQFLTGNLEFLGLRLDLAFNLPSIIFFVSACMLLYSLAVKLFEKRTVGLLAVILFMFRSGTAFGKYLAEIDDTMKEIIKKADENSAFIGYTQNEEWGLYNLNVYANQRHLAFGLSMLILAIIIMLPNVFGAVKRLSYRSANAEGEKKNFIKNSVLYRMIFSAEGWGIIEIRRPVIAGLLIGLSSFYNGACVIACLLVLFVLAFLSDRRLEYLITAVISVVLAMLQTKIFIDGSAFSFRWEPGYLANVKTFFGTMSFLYSLIGIAMVVIVAAAMKVEASYRWILFAFISPIIFALCFQLTIDTSVNHKYIMIGMMLADVFIAYFLYWLFSQRQVFIAVTSFGLLGLLTATGIYDFTVFLKRNSVKNYGMLSFDRDSEITKWVMENSDSRDIWLTDWYSLNDVVMGGAMLYYGWPYYAWSAGYDTFGREAKVHAMYGAGDSETLDRLVKEENIRFIVVDHDLRMHEGMLINEANISNTYEEVFTRDENEWRFSIYDTTKPAKEKTFG